MQSPPPSNQSIVGSSRKRKLASASKYHSTPLADKSRQEKDDVVSDKRKDTLSDRLSDEEPKKAPTSRMFLLQCWKTLAYKYSRVSSFFLQCLIAAIVFGLCTSDVSAYNVFLEKMHYSEALTSAYYKQWLLVSVFVAVPLSAELFLDIRRVIWGTSESRWQWLSFFSLNISFLLPSAVMYLVLHNTTSISSMTASYHLNLIVVQQSFILASLLALLYGPKLYHSTTEMRFNFQKSIERAAINALFCVLVATVLFSVLFHVPSNSLISWGLTIATVCALSVGLCFVFFLVSRLLYVLGGIAWRQGRIANHHQLFDLGVSFLLSVFCIGDFVIAVWAAFGFSNSNLRVENVLVGYTAMQILLTGLTGLLTGQRSKKQAKFKHEKLQGRLNLIRYVSHEMRTPLNTAFMGLNILSSELDNLKMSCVSEAARDAFGYSRPSSSSASSISTTGHTNINTSLPVVSFRSDMVFVGKHEAHASSGPLLNLATDTNASSSTQLDPYAAPNQVSFTRRNDANASGSSSFSMRSSTSDFGISLSQAAQNNAHRYGSETNTIRSQQTSISIETVDDLFATVSQISESCKVALATLDDLLTFDKLDEKKLTIETQETNPWAFLSNAAQPFRINARESQVKMHIGAAQVETKWYDSFAINIDQFKLSQVIRNLLSNAIKFTPTDGTVTVMLEPLFDSATVLVDAMESPVPKDFADSSRDDDNETLYVRISVTDSGAGISPENQKKLFGQYVQFNASKLQKGKGSGLGLWITKNIVELHHGKIGCQSLGEGEGSTFYVDLPVRRVSVPTTVPPPNNLSKNKQGTYAMPMKRSHSAKRRSMLSQHTRAAPDDDEDEELGNFECNEEGGDMPVISSTARSRSIYSSFFNNSVRRHSSAMHLQHMNSISSRVSVQNAAPAATTNTANHSPSSKLPKRSNSMLGDIANYLLGIPSGNTQSSPVGRQNIHSTTIVDPELGSTHSSPTSPKRPSSMSRNGRIDSGTFFSSAAAVASPGTPIGSIACIVDDSVLHSPANLEVSESLQSTSVKKPGFINANSNLVSEGSAAPSPSAASNLSGSSSPSRQLANANNRPLPASPPQRIPSFLQLLTRNSPSNSPKNVSSPPSTTSSANNNLSPLNISIAGYTLPKTLAVSDKKLAMLMTGGGSSNGNSAPASPSHITLLSPKSSHFLSSKLLDESEKIVEGEDGEEEDTEENDSVGAVRPDLSDQRLTLSLSHEVLKQHRQSFGRINSNKQQPMNLAFDFPSVSPEHPLRTNNDDNEVYDRDPMMSSPVLSLPSSVAPSPHALTPTHQQAQLQQQRSQQAPQQLSPTRSPSRSPLAMRRSALGLVPDAHLQSQASLSSRHNSAHTSRNHSPLPTNTANGIIKTPPRAQLMTQLLPTDQQMSLPHISSSDKVNLSTSRSRGVYDADVEDEEALQQQQHQQQMFDIVDALTLQGKENSPTPVSLQQDSMSSMDSHEMDNARVRYANNNTNNNNVSMPGSVRNHRAGLSHFRQIPSQHSMLSSHDGTLSSYSTTSRSMSASISRTSSRCLDLPSPRITANNTSVAVDPNYQFYNSHPHNFTRSMSRSRSIDLQDAQQTTALLLSQLQQPLHNNKSNNNTSDNIMTGQTLDPTDMDALTSAMCSILDSPGQQPPSAPITQPLTNSNTGSLLYPENDANQHTTQDDGPRHVQRWEDGLNILIVDDSAPNRKICARLLSSKGHNIVEAVDGKHCLDVYQRLVGLQEERVDLILMDDNMPNMCGPDTARILRSYNNNTNSSINNCLKFQGAIFGVTGDVEAAAVERFMAAGANTVLAKPLVLETLRLSYETFVRNQLE